MLAALVQGSTPLRTLRRDLSATRRRSFHVSLDTWSPALPTGTNNFFDILAACAMADLPLDHSSTSRMPAKFNMALDTATSLFHALLFSFFCFGSEGQRVVGDSMCVCN